MALMTSGLRKIAGEKLREWLARSTQSPVKGVITGATVTALVQSSSATTLAAIGFVGAGLMTFSESLGIIFGANIGTTITGWMVALIGLKLKLTETLLPVLLVSALVYLLNEKTVIRGVGKSIAGFCLVFIGIRYLQSGLAEYQDVLLLERWSATGLSGRAVLLLIGVAITLVTQSSSATVAMTLTALNSSLIDLPQAGALIIGADIGTTGTAALATIGGTAASRRTGVAHVIYNCMTGLTAFLILPLYLWLFASYAPERISDSPEFVAVSFHSFFNIIGVLLVLPFTHWFAKVIERIIPDRTPSLVASFDESILPDTFTAIAGLQAGTTRLALKAFELTDQLITSPLTRADFSKATEICLAVGTGRQFAAKIGHQGILETDHDTQEVFRCLHQLDHIERLCERISAPESVRITRSVPNLQTDLADTEECLTALIIHIRTGDPVDAIEKLRLLSERMEHDKSGYREQAIAQTVSGLITGDELNRMLDAQRWLRRVTYHAWRIADYWQQGSDARWAPSPIS